MKRLKGSLCALAAGILWGAMGLYVRTLYARGFTAMQVVSVRMLVALERMADALERMAGRKMEVKRWK